MVHGETHHFASRAPQPDGSSSVVIYLYLDDTDAAIARAIGAGASVVLAAEDQFWGDRVGRLIDPEAHVWNIASRVRSK
jgi:PhnB protein